MKKITTFFAFICTLNMFGQAQPVSVDTDNKIFIDFVGSGDIQQSITNGSKYNANTGLGMIFERTNDKSADGGKCINVFQSLEIEAVFNIASTADTLVASFDETTLEIDNRRNFGNYILNPISAKQSLYVNSNIFFGYPDNWFGNWISPVVSGANIRVITSNNSWDYKDKVEDLGALAFRIGIFHEFLPDNYRFDDDGRVKYSLFLGTNFSYRGIFGDIKADENLRQEILGSKQTDFKAMELNFGFRLDNLRVEFQMPMFKYGNNIDGLTGTQFLFTLKFIGGFGLKLDPRK